MRKLVSLSFAWRCFISVQLTAAFLYSYIAVHSWAHIDLADSSSPPTWLTFMAHLTKVNALTKRCGSAVSSHLERSLRGEQLKCDVKELCSAFMREVRINHGSGGWHASFRSYVGISGWRGCLSNYRPPSLVFHIMPAIQALIYVCRWSTQIKLPAATSFLSFNAFGLKRKPFALESFL